MSEKKLKNFNCRRCGKLISPPPFPGAESFANADFDYEFSLLIKFVCPHCRQNYASTYKGKISAGQIIIDN